MVRFSCLGAVGRAERVSDAPPGFAILLCGGGFVVLFCAVLAKRHAEVFALGHNHHAGQQFAGRLPGLDSRFAVGVHVHLHGFDFGRAVQGSGRVVYTERGGHGAEGEGALQKGKRFSAALVPLLDLLPRPFPRLGIEAVALALRCTQPGSAPARAGRGKGGAAAQYSRARGGFCRASTPLDGRGRSRRQLW